MNPREVRDTIVIPTLTTLALGYRQQDIDLLMGTGMQESGFKFRRQLGGGPALGLWQMEPATHDDCWKNFLAFRRTLAIRVNSIGGWDHPTNPSASLLETNDAYACAMARIKYLRTPEPFPDPSKDGYVEALASFYCRHYNAGGKATVAEFVANWKALQDALA